MRILVGGASGLVGGALLPRLTAAGHEIVRLTRGGEAGARATAGAGAGGVPWDPDRGILEPSAIARFDAVIHLGGASIASGRWSVDRKQLILESRTRSTLLLAERIAALPAESRPRVFVVASATGYYGDRGDTLLDESSGPGDGFLADVCRAWEEAAAPAASAGVRVVQPRIGVVLAREGGALAAMLLPFRLGLGGPIGSGRQWWPWISLHDLARVFERALVDGTLSGTVNAVAPEAATCADVSRALGRALRRPAILPVPAFAIRLLLGEMADALLLASTKVAPARLTRAGFVFDHTGLDAAMRAALER